MIQRLYQLHQHHRRKFSVFTRFSLYLLGFGLLCLAYWINQNFGEPSLEQIIYHLQFGAEGLVDTDAAILRSFGWLCLALPAGLAIFTMGLEHAIGHARSHRWAITVGRGRSIPVRALKKASRAAAWTIGPRAPLYLLLFAVLYFGTEFSAMAFIHQRFGRDYFAQHYVAPAKVSLAPGKHTKNLVLIYVESLENTYRDSGLFGRNLLASLDALGGVSFENYRQAPGTGWTIAGITATQCGVPLKTVTMFDINDQGENIRGFLPNAVCLGDVLSRYGYINVYMGGDALGFSGKGKFFQTHHYAEVYGRDELKGNLTADDMNFWGLYDDDLLARVKDKLRHLHASGQRFNLTFTTIDTHGPDGHYSRHCLQQAVRDFPGIVQCTSDQVAEFIDFIKKSGYLKDTNVVVLGDHLVMSNPVSPLIDRVAERHIYNAFISRQPFVKNRDNLVHFDLYPTILEFLGIKVEGGRLGLGYSAWSKSGPLPSPEEFEEMQADLLNKSDEYLALWRTPH